MHLYKQASLDRRTKFVTSAAAKAGFDVSPRTYVGRRPGGARKQLVTVLDTPSSDSLYMVDHNGVSAIPASDLDTLQRSSQRLKWVLHDHGLMTHFYDGCNDCAVLDRPDGVMPLWTWHSSAHTLLRDGGAYAPMSYVPRDQWDTPFDNPVWANARQQHAADILWVYGTLTHPRDASV